MNNHFPVNILLPDTSKLFEVLCDKYELINNFSNGLSKKLELVCTDDYLDNYAEVKKHFDEDNNIYYKIHIWDNYCQFLWSLCYASMVAIDEYIIKPTLEPNHQIDHNKTEVGYDIFIQGMSLFQKNLEHRANRGVFFNLPNPVNNIDDKNVLSANLLFKASLCFVLFHEYQHFNLGHMEKTNDISDEYDADYSAFFSMYEDTILEQRKYLSLGIVIASGSLIFMDNTAKGDDSHPDPDNRLQVLLNNIENELDPQGVDYCYCMATTLYKMWAFYYRLELIIPSMNFDITYKEYFSQILEAFNIYKQNLTHPTHQS